MSRRARSGPPAAWLAIIRALVRSDRREEVTGDLIELWELRRSAGVVRRSLAFWRDACSIVLERRPRVTAPAGPPLSRGAVIRAVTAVPQDLHFAWRLVIRQPAFALLAVSTLTIGIGSATAIFTICDRVLLRPLAYPDADRLVELNDVRYGFGPNGAAILPSYRALPEFSAMGMYQSGGLNLGSEATPLRLRAAAVNSGFFDALGVRPLAGRTFNAADDRRARVAIIAFDAWRRVFGGDRQLVNRQIRLNSQSFTVIGVMPRGFTFPDQVDVWVPPLTDHQLTGTAYTPRVLGRLAPGVSVPHAIQALMRAKAALGEAEPGGQPPIMPILKDRLTQGVRPTLLFLAAIVGLLLAATWANVAGLLLSRFRVRERELLVRTALGAGRLRLCQQLITESLVLTSAGAMAGLVAAWWMVGGFAASVPGFVPDIDLSDLDMRFFTVGAVVTAVSTLCFGVGPALAASRNAGGRIAADHVTAGRRPRWFGSSLVVSQVSVALLLLVATGAALTAVVRLMQVDLGFGNRQALLLELTLPRARYGTGPATTDFLDRLETRLRAVPGIVHVGATNFAPGATKIIFAAGLSISGMPPLPVGPEGRPALALLLSATPDYFRAMGIPLVAGRFFMAADRKGAPRVVILNDAAARWLDPDVGRLLGRRMPIDDDDKAGSTIVGIVGSVRLRGPITDPPAQLYEPMAQSQSPDSLGVVIDATGDRGAAIVAVRQVLHDIDSELPIYNITSVRDLRARFLPTERVTLALASAFSAIALLLCAVGLYGTLAQVVAQRTREIGIRMALGADRARLRWGIVATGLRLALAGVVLGGVLAGLAFRLAAKFIPLLELPRIETIAMSTGVLLVVAVLAAWVPARRASSVDPVRALRAE